MSFNFIEYLECKNIVPFKLEGKENYFLDLMNIEQSWTGRIDAVFSHIFFDEAVQLIVNAITLFEKGYFDCAFYSLRQSLETSTSAIYFVDDDDKNREQKMLKWKNQGRFPMYNNMITELQERGKVFSDIKEKMSLYFQEIEETKQKLNKYVHKQGYNKFYVLRNHPLYKITELRLDKLLCDFTAHLIKCMGAVAVFRLAIDPYPLLLVDKSIYNRTGQLLTEGFNESFIEKYIGKNHAEAYKQTKLYKGFYEAIIVNEEMLPSVVDVVKHNFVDRSKIDEIMSQKNLLSNYDLVSVSLFLFSEKIVKVYCIGGFHWYFTNIQSKRFKTSWSSRDFDVNKTGDLKYNVNYDGAFLSAISIGGENYFIEHNEEFSEKEIDELSNFGIILDTGAIRDET